MLALGTFSLETLFEMSYRSPYFNYLNDDICTQMDCDPVPDPYKHNFNSIYVLCKAILTSSRKINSH